MSKTDWAIAACAVAALVLVLTFTFEPSKNMCAGNLQFLSHVSSICKGAKNG